MFKFIMLSLQVNLGFKSLNNSIVQAMINGNVDKVNKFTKVMGESAMISTLLKCLLDAGYETDIEIETSTEYSVLREYLQNLTDSYECDVVDLIKNYSEEKILPALEMELEDMEQTQKINDLLNNN